VGAGLFAAERAAERASVLTQAQSLITEGMNGAKRALVIRRLANIHTLNRPVIVARALLWARGLVGDAYFNRLLQVFETHLDQPIADNMAAAALVG